MRPLGAEWRERHLRPELQKYLHGRFPEGYGIIYAIVLRHSHEKGYVGQCHSKSGFKGRRSFHKSASASHCRALNAAVAKYGWNAFFVFVVDLLPVDELDDAEYEFIRQFRTLAPGGYNLKEGGLGGGLCEESNEKMKATQRDDAHRQAQKKRCERQWACDETASRLVKAQNEGKKRKWTEKLRLAREKALPYERKTENRVVGQYYFNHKGQVTQCVVAGPVMAANGQSNYLHIVCAELQ